jgi:hypothetical protein
VSLANPQSWNRYSYVLNSPLNLIDPLGLCGGGMFDPGSPCVSFSYQDENGCTITVTYQKVVGWDGFTYDMPELSTPVCPGDLGGPGGPGSPGGGSTIGPQTNWFYTRQADCLGDAAKATVGGLVMKKEIDAALSPILGGADTIEGPVGPSAVAVTAEIGLDAVAGSPNNRPVIATIRAALREEGWKVSGNALARMAKFLGKAALVAHAGFALNDGREAYNACMEN